MDTTRIKELAKAQGKTLSYVCQLIGRKVYYLNDLKKTSEMMADEDLHIVPLSAYPNPSLYGVRYSFKQEDTPYHNGRECLFF